MVRSDCIALIMLLSSIWYCVIILQLISEIEYLKARDQTISEELLRLREKIDDLHETKSTSASSTSATKSTMGVEIVKIAYYIISMRS